MQAYIAKQFDNVIKLVRQAGDLTTKAEQEVRLEISSGSSSDAVFDSLIKRASPTIIARALGGECKLAVYPEPRSAAETGATQWLLQHRGLDHKKILLVDADCALIRDEEVNKQILYIKNPLSLDSVQKLLRDLQGIHHQKCDVMGVIAVSELATLRERVGMNIGSETGGAVLADESGAGNEGNLDFKAGEQSKIGQRLDAYFDELVTIAAKINASDIHFEPTDDCVRIRYRVNGDMVKRGEVKHQDYFELANRIMTRSKGEAGSYRTRFDGMMVFPIKDARGGVIRSIKLRVNMIPATLAQHKDQIPKFTIRLLGNRVEDLKITDLGIPDTRENPQMTNLRMLSEKKHGLILVTGPTGSGKTTTLNAALMDMRTKSPDKQYYTIEDPVEMAMFGVTHVTVNDEAKLTFQEGLKAFLRADPDVILVGEIRDKPVADLAFTAALTGHLVFSTLHTNSAVRAVTRLVNMGIAPYVIADALKAVFAQRLVRPVCQRCALKINWDDLTSGNHACTEGEDNVLMRLRYQRAPTMYQDLDFYPRNNQQVRVRAPSEISRGCQSCGGSGYARGRMVISELLTMSPTLEDMVNHGESSARIQEEAVKEGFKEMWQHGFLLISQGLIAFDDAIGAIGEREAMFKSRPIHPETAARWSIRESEAREAGRAATELPEPAAVHG